MEITLKINPEDFSLFELLAEKLKAKIIIKDNSDSTLLTKEEYFAKIDKARNSPKRKVSNEERKKMLGI